MIGAWWKRIVTPGCCSSLELLIYSSGFSPKVRAPTSVSQKPLILSSGWIVTQNHAYAGLPWTQLMDSALHAAHTELNAAQEDVLKAIHSTPFPYRHDRGVNPSCLILQVCNADMPASCGSLQSIKRLHTNSVDI